MKDFLLDLKEGIISVFKGKPKEENLFSLNGRVPLKRAIPFGLQHVLAMFISNITPLIIVFGALDIYNTSLSTQAILGSLFMAGIGTIIQLLIGARLPIVIGTSFTFVGIFITIGLSSGGGVDGYYTILGSILAGGLIASFCCLFIKWWGKLIKPIVPCIVVLGIGLSLLKSGATQFLGGSSILSSIANGGSSPVPYYFYLIAAMITLISSILWQIFAKGTMKNLNIIFGIIVGYLFCLCVNGMIDFSLLKINSIKDVIMYPSFVNVGKFKFELVPILLTTLCFLISTVEGIGDANAICSDGLKRNPTNREITGVVVTDGLNSSVCSFFGTLPLTTFAQNVGIVTQTKVVNRFTIFIGGIFLIICSCFPLLANFLRTIPECVLGGTMIVLFGSILVVGMKMCSKVGFSEKNVLIISLSICLGFGLTLVSDFFSLLNNYNLKYLSDLLSNNVLNMFIISFILSWVLPEDMNFSFKKKISQ